MASNWVYFMSLYFMAEDLPYKSFDILSLAENVHRKVIGQWHILVL